MTDNHNKNANSVENTTDKSVQTKDVYKLTGRLEVRLPEAVELALLALLANNTKTKSEVIHRLILKCRLYNHLTDEETEIYLMLKECRDAFVKIKSALSSFNEKERLKFFHDDPEYMTTWIALIDQCIEQWVRIIRKLSE